MKTGAAIIAQLKEDRKPLVLLFPVAVSIGAVVALFLWLLDVATETRHQYPWLLYLLPLAGIAIVLVYHHFGKNSAAGNNLIIDEIHEPGAGIPARMTPFILVSTVVTHLFGGSAGREGTAVQMGGSLAAMFAKVGQLKAGERRVLLMCGVAAGFGAVFGTPWAGAIFAVEVLVVGGLQLRYVLHCVLAAYVGHLTCMQLGAHHTVYTVAAAAQHYLYFAFDYKILLWVLPAAVAFGLAARLFSVLVHMIQAQAKKYIKTYWLIPVAGGVMVIAITGLLGTTDYLGLGVSSPDKNGVSILQAFHAGGSDYFSWWWKLLLTAITLGTGFKGGEVTPLFFIGATLGNTYAILSGTPVDLLAALGFVAVFAAATHTPLASTIMAMELFGGEYLIYFSVVCWLASRMNKEHGIYTSQRIKKRNGK